MEYHHICCRSPCGSVDRNAGNIAVPATGGVAPLAGAWIEIVTVSLLKSYENVAPLAGAWIEINTLASRSFVFLVAPLAGAWIEIRQREDCSG